MFVLIRVEILIICDKEIVPTYPIINTEDLKCV